MPNSFTPQYSSSDNNQVLRVVHCILIDLAILGGEVPMDEEVSRSDVQGTLECNLEVLRKLVQRGAPMPRWTDILLAVSRTSAEAHKLNNLR